MGTAMAAERHFKASSVLAEVPAGAPTMAGIVAHYSRYVATIGFRILATYRQIGRAHV